MPNNNKNKNNNRRRGPPPSRSRPRKRAINQPRRRPMSSSLVTHRKTAPLGYGVTLRTQKPRSVDTKMGRIVSHTEYVSQVDVIEKKSGGDTIQAIPINPGLATTFPWLAPIAKQYDYYRLIKMVIRYVAACPSTTEGKFNGYFDYNASHGGAPTVAAMMQNYKATSSSLWQDAVIPVDPVRVHLLNKWKGTRSSSSADDVQNTEVGTFFYNMESPINVDNLGHLEIGYVFEFAIEQYPAPFVFPQASMEFNSAGTTQNFTAGDSYAPVNNSGIYAIYNSAGVVMNNQSAAYECDDTGCYEVRAQYEFRHDQGVSPGFDDQPTRIEAKVEDESGAFSITKSTLTANTDGGADGNHNGTIDITMMVGIGSALLTSFICYIRSDVRDIVVTGIRLLIQQRRVIGPLVGLGRVPALLSSDLAFVKYHSTLTRPPGEVLKIWSRYRNRTPSPAALRYVHEWRLKGPEREDPVLAALAVEFRPLDMSAKEEAEDKGLETKSPGLTRASTNESEFEPIGDDLSQSLIAARDRLDAEARRRVIKAASAPMAIPKQ